MSALPRDEAKHWWLRCVSCSETSLTQHNRSFGTEATDLEQSAGLFSGGFLHQGEACGLLQGAVLAAGVQARARFPDDEELAASAALEAARRLVAAYPEVAESTNCRGITGLDFNRLSDRVSYLRSGKARHCGRLSLAWVERGHAIIEEVLKACETAPPPPCHSCVRAAKKRFRGLDAGDALALAGYAGGLGLSGNVCGVLAAGVMALSARHYQGRGAARRDSRLVGSLQELGLPVGLRRRANRLRMTFEARFGSRRCAEIIGRSFDGPSDHARYVAEDGCKDLIDLVVAETRD